MVIDRGCVPRTPATTARPSLHQPTVRMHKQDGDVSWFL
ncbi:hypothetical protein T03_5495 [Trichinella britovi]|uniref:Uncharacterized protein n=1 Tax=Trichinella britovi TaxID=45882 RepID=A0A0V0YXU3_TRIBR|nr:hypothetical protein T03_5495 [Trichinella britovi]